MMSKLSRAFLTRSMIRGTKTSLIQFYPCSSVTKDKCAHLEEHFHPVDEEENDNDEHKECVTTVEDVGDVKVV